MDSRIHQLVDSIYAASLEPGRWQDVVDQLSGLFDGSPVILGLNPIGDGGTARYACNADPNLAAEFLQRVMIETGWSTRQLRQFARDFRQVDHGLAVASLEELDLYQSFMKPRGFAPVWPAGHSIYDSEGRAAGGVTIFRKEGQGPFLQSALDEAGQLVRHLCREMDVQQALRESQSKRVALGEAVDRLPTGVLLLDSERRVVLENRCARRILADDDGLRVDLAGPCALDAQDNVRLQGLIAGALDPAVDQLPAGGFAKITRPSGRREYAVLVAPLVEAGGPGISRDAVLVVFVVDPESSRSAPAEGLEDLYELTHSEAELVRLLAQGLSLEEAAAGRGVSVNTARSHLKHAFAKTGTGRQSELLRLVLAGVGAIGEAVPGPAEDA